MREKWQKQMPLMPQIKDHAQAKELIAIGDIINAHTILCDRVLQDLNKGKLVAARIYGLTRRKYKYELIYLNNEKLSPYHSRLGQLSQLSMLFKIPIIIELYIDDDRLVYFLKWCLS